MIIQHTLYRPDRTGHGGNRRSAQIREFLCGLGVQVTSVGYDGPTRISPASTIAISFLWGVIQSILHPRVFFLSPSLATTINLGYLSIELHKTLKGVDPENVTVVWESTEPTMYPSVKSLLKKGVRVIALPHNVECLSSPKKGLRGISGLIRAEIEILSLVEEVICISETDTWFYSNLGIAASTWPYMPDSKELESHKAIRARRDKSLKDTLLILGTSKNEATRQGIFRLLESNASSKAKFRIALVSSGFILPPGSRFPNVEIYPDLPHEKLEAELERALAIVIHQSRGTGLLTRIQEAHNMGIPVFGNELSGRGYGLRADSVPRRVRDSFPGLNFFEIFPTENNMEHRTDRLMSTILEKN